MLLCCYEHQWGELKYVKKRKSKYDDTEPDVIVEEQEENVAMYHSQEHRYPDIQ